MKQYTLRQIQDLPFKEKDKVLSQSCELGFKTSGPKPKFSALGVYMPISEYNKLKGYLNSCKGIYNFSEDEVSFINKVLKGESDD